MTDWQAQHRHLLPHAGTEERLVAALTQMAGALGFAYWSLALQLPLPMSAPQIAVVSNYPVAWRQRYLAADYGRCDPTLAFARHPAPPVVWSAGLFADVPAMREDALAHGLAFGWTQSGHDAAGLASCLSLVRAVGEVTVVECAAKTADFAWLAQAAHAAAKPLLLRRHLPEAEVLLTLRERDVLRWAADGKTAGETAVVMRIAEPTVNFHMKNSLVKLRAPNKTAGVVKAAMLGLLFT